MQQTIGDDSKHTNTGRTADSLTSKPLLNGICQIIGTIKKADILEHMSINYQLTKGKSLFFICFAFGKRG